MLENLLPVFTAIGLGSIVAALITREVAIAQLRQAWINALRDDIAEFIGRVHEWAQLQGVSRTRAMTAEDGGRLINAEYTAEVALSRIAMRLNPKETPHKQLLEHLRNLRAPDPKDMKLSISINDAISEAQQVLKQEW